MLLFSIQIKRYPGLLQILFVKIGINNSQKNQKIEN